MENSERASYLLKQADLANQVSKERDNTWSAPSAEHALAWLRVEFQWREYFATKTHLNENETRYEFPVKNIFRGQGNKDWGLQPGLLRLEGEDRLQEEKATLIFTKVVENLFSMMDQATKDMWPPLNSTSGLATAQHYGLNTTLLDWTVTPAVAVDMATKTIKQRREQFAAVYWINFEDVEDLGVEIILPPVFAHRLYFQRGFFTNSNKDQLKNLNYKVQRIIFPLDYNLACEGIDLASNTVVEMDLLPVNKRFDFLRLWSKVKAYKYRSMEQGRRGID